jgi:hypothetical protein
MSSPADDMLAAILAAGVTPGPRQDRVRLPYDPASIDSEPNVLLAFREMRRQPGNTESDFRTSETLGHADHPSACTQIDV